MSQVTATKSHNNSYFDNPTHTHSLAGRDTTFLTLTVTRSSGVQVTTIELGNGSRETPAVSSDVVAEPPADTVTSAPPPANSDDQGTSDGPGGKAAGVILTSVVGRDHLADEGREDTRASQGYRGRMGSPDYRGRRASKGYLGIRDLEVKRGGRVTRDQRAKQGRPVFGESQVRREKQAHLDLKAGRVHRVKKDKLVVLGMETLTGWVNWAGKAKKVNVGNKAKGVNVGSKAEGEKRAKGEKKEKKEKKEKREEREKEEKGAKRVSVGSKAEGVKRVNVGSKAEGVKRAKRAKEERRERWQYWTTRTTWAVWTTGDSGYERTKKVPRTATRERTTGG
ncbi:hypothetical protein F4824DRAFT_498504 [Ustulina deusta]|nr:hypothetical protein F4824DRAFT_498504 [Ustulina deusta]